MLYQTELKVGDGGDKADAAKEDDIRLEDMQG